MIFPHTVTLLPSVDATDDYGTPRKVPADTGPDSPAFMQPRQSTEGHSSQGAATGQRIVDHWVVYLPAPSVLDGWSHLRWEGDVYEVDGDPGRFDTPAGPHHKRTNLRRVR